MFLFSTNLSWESKYGCRNEGVWMSVANFTEKCVKMNGEDSARYLHECFFLRLPRRRQRIIWDTKLWV